ncbi:ABC transporter substrate-binding protein [uncultured Endozoicomonas sp.]|uniref:ABC transporter substrate-binding protein n=1 Tax=uncultured Endozoicomonas sp. TaxID=432652 RepID=UPI00261F0F97|nr:ABC transporter substrate-binding protein [uncultured Endozoicomonas sp.]
MNNKLYKPFLFLLILFGFSFRAFAAFEPLSEVITTPVGPVKESSTIKLPMITWGGDTATIFTNGLSTRTQKGSLFDQAGLDVNLVRQDDFKQQLREYLSGETPFLRCTVGMCNQAIELLSKDERTKPVVIYQMTWSKGGDGLVAKKGIGHTKYLRGKTISLQAYGPHVDFLTTMLQDQKIGVDEVTLDWQPDLTLSDNAPAASFLNTDVDAAFMVLPDALVLTSNRSIGSGSDGSVEGARLITSTMFFKRIIADVYVVRSDYFDSNRGQVKKLVAALMEGQRQMLAVMDQLNTKQRVQLLTKAAEYLLDDKTALGPMEELILDAEFVDLAANRQFLQSEDYQHNLPNLTARIQSAYQDLGLIGGNYPMQSAQWSYDEMALAQ